MDKISDEIYQEVHGIIRQSHIDLFETFSKIKKSNKILKYKNDGHLITDIFMNILAHFTVAEILETSFKAKMVIDSTGEELPRKDRFKAIINLYQSKFEYIINQHLELIS